MVVVNPKSLLKVVLVDVNPRVVEAWRLTFADTPDVEIVRGSLLDQNVDAWVSPTNSRGSMDGGVDAVIKGYFGAGIERRVKKEIRERHGRLMPVGHATCVPTGAATPRFLISTPTMVRSAEDVSDTRNVALACAAAFQAVHMQNAREPDSIRSVALPGLGAATGRVPPRVCANLMWSGFHLFRDYEFRDFAAMRAALREQFGDLGDLPETVRPRVVLPDLPDEPADPQPWIVR